MDRETLKDKAALIAFQFLLERKKAEKDIDTKILSVEVWEMVTDFMENRPGTCYNCPYSHMDKAACAAADTPSQGAGPKPKQ